MGFRPGFIPRESRISGCDAHTLMWSSIPLISLGKRKRKSFRYPTTPLPCQIRFNNLSPVDCYAAAAWAGLALSLISHLQQDSILRCSARTRQREADCLEQDRASLFVQACANTMKNCLSSLKRAEGSPGCGRGARKNCQSDFMEYFVLSPPLIRHVLTQESAKDPWS